MAHTNDDFQRLRAATARAAFDFLMTELGVGNTMLDLVAASVDDVSRQRRHASADDARQQVQLHFEDDCFTDIQRETLRSGLAMLNQRFTAMAATGLFAPS